MLWKPGRGHRGSDPTRTLFTSRTTTSSDPGWRGGYVTSSAEVRRGRRPERAEDPQRRTPRGACRAAPRRPAPADRTMTTGVPRRRQGRYLLRAAPAAASTWDLRKRRRRHGNHAGPPGTAGRAGGGQQAARCAHAWSEHVRGRCSGVEAGHQVCACVLRSWSSDQRRNL